MAEAPTPELLFEAGCQDCGLRRVELPPPLPVIGDDFDWLIRDYDSFRLFMLEELAGRFPQRRRWTPADLEVILVEALSVILDRLSDQLDRAQDSTRLPKKVWDSQVDGEPSCVLVGCPSQDPFRLHPQAQFLAEPD